MNSNTFIKNHKVKSKKDLLNFLKSVSKDANIRVLTISFDEENTFENENDLDKQIFSYLENLTTPVITTINQDVSEFLLKIVLLSHICIAVDSINFDVKGVKKQELALGKKTQENPKLLQKTFNAETAYSLGLINQISTSETIEKDASEMAEKISKLAPIAISSCLKAIDYGLKNDLEDGLRFETELFSKIFGTKDMREGTSAFLEKRKPYFQGK